MKRLASLFRAKGRLLVDDTSGVALLEFALTLPILLLMSLTGAELTNYITTKMRISQIALHLADNSARMGTGTQLSSKTISETDINDLLTGANLQSGELALFTNGRVVISDLEPTASPNTAGTYKIGWQRCSGSKTTYKPAYGTYGLTADRTTNGVTEKKGVNMTGMGPTSRQTIAPDGGASMFVEVYYEYQPLVKTSLSPASNFTEIASMMVRDRRDLTRIYNTENATISSC